MCPCLLALLSHARCGTVYELTANLDGCLSTSIVWMSFSHKTSVWLSATDTVSIHTSVLLLHFMLQFHGLWLKIICSPFSEASQPLVLSLHIAREALPWMWLLLVPGEIPVYTVIAKVTDCFVLNKVLLHIASCVPGVFKITTSCGVWVFFISEVLNLWIKIAVIKWPYWFLKWYHTFKKGFLRLFPCFQATLLRRKKN